MIWCEPDLIPTVSNWSHFDDNLDKLKWPFVSIGLGRKYARWQQSVNCWAKQHGDRRVGSPSSAWVVRPRLVPRVVIACCPIAHAVVPSACPFTDCRPSLAVLLSALQLFFISFFGAIFKQNKPHTILTQVLPYNVQMDRRIRAFYLSILHSIGMVFI